MIKPKTLVIVGSLARNKNKMGQIGIVLEEMELVETKVFKVVMPNRVDYFLEKELKNLLLTDAPDQMTLIAPLKKD